MATPIKSKGLDNFSRMTISNTTMKKKIIKRTKETWMEFLHNMSSSSLNKVTKEVLWMAHITTKILVKIKSNSGLKISILKVVTKNRKEVESILRISSILSKSQVICNRQTNFSYTLPKL